MPQPADLPTKTRSHSWEHWEHAALIALFGGLVITSALWGRTVEFSAEALTLPAIILGSFILLAVACSSLFRLLEKSASEQDEIDELLADSERAAARSDMAEKNFLERKRDTSSATER